MTCYCEERSCVCTPEIIAQVENIMDDSGRGGSVHNRTGWTAKAAAKIVTPLTYSDAEALAQTLMTEKCLHPGMGSSHPWLKHECRFCLADAFMAVDYAARHQAQEPLISAIAALGLRADEEGDLVARSIAAQAISTARGE